MSDLTPLEAAEMLEFLSRHFLVKDYINLPGYKEAVGYAASLLRAIAAGEYKRVKHAHWTGRTLVNGEYHFTCSHCQYGCSHGKSKTPIWDYCPNCGYSMEEKDDGHDG